jgi:hypothetical protein
MSDAEWADASKEIT